MTEITPQLLVCWGTLAVTVIGLLVAFYFTNRDAFPNRRRQDQLEARNPYRGPYNE
jgi:hypothetical protein